MKKVFSYRPEIVAFLSGAIVMVFEILGSRIVGPYIGTSLFVWTSIIAIILGALSLGYYLGGKLADRTHDIKVISDIFTIVSINFLVLFLFKESILIFITSLTSEIRLMSISAALVLFSPISFLLGMVPPIITKFQMSDLKTGGGVIGRISSIGTVGSIVGTLCAGFFLIPFFGVSQLLFLLGALSLGIAFFCSTKDHKLKIILGFLFCIGFFISKQTEAQLAQLGVHIFDTAYSHITIEEAQKSTGEQTRTLRIDNISHAGMYLNSDELLFDYTKHYHLFNILNPKAKDVLMLGGAAYSYPKSFLKTYPDKKLDVVEIDPQITELAKEYFGLPKSPNLEIYHQDARFYLNTATKKYDAILGDAFGSYYSVPYQLTTLETVQKKYDLLNDGGVVVLNIIGSLQGEKSRFIQAEYKTYQKVFPEVFVIPVSSPDTEVAQNVMLIALKTPSLNSYETNDTMYKTFLSRKLYLDIRKDTKILTDDFAPVDYYTSKISQK